VDKTDTTDLKESLKSSSTIKLGLTAQGIRRLTTYELAKLRQDMAESSAKMRTELARRRNDCPTKQGL